MRQWVWACVLTASLLAGAGCLGVADTSGDCTGELVPNATAEEPTLSPGESTTLRVEAENVSRMQLRLPETEEVEFELTDASHSPSLGGQMDSYPPIWLWGECTDVETTVPVSAAADAEPGTYNYSVRAWFYHDNSTVGVDERFNVTVAGA